MTHLEAVIAALHEIIDLAHTSPCTWRAADATVEKYAELVQKMAAIASDATIAESAIAQATTAVWAELEE